MAKKVSPVFGLLGLTAVADSLPSAPVDSPAVWAVLAWARRQFGQSQAAESRSAGLDAAAKVQSVDEPAAAEPFAAFAAAAVVVNKAPTALPSQSAPNQTTGVVTGSINGADADGNTLSYAVSSAPTSGTVAVNASTGAFTYTPTQAARLAAGITSAADYDTFTVTVNDGQTTTPAKVSVAVLPTQLSAASSTKVGSSPAGMAVSASKIYVANSASNTVSVIDRTTGAVGTLFVMSTPTAVALSQDGRSLYVAGNNAVSVIDTTWNWTISQVSTQGGQSYGLAVSPNGQRLYVTNAGNNTVSVLNTSQRMLRLVGNVSVGSAPAGVAVSPDGAKVYVANQSGGTVSVINTADNTVVGSPIQVGANPFGVAVSPDSSRVYVSNMGSDSVSVINAAAVTPSVVSTIAVGDQPRGLALSPDGGVLYAANGVDTVSVINTKTGAVMNTVTVDSAAENNWHGIAVSPDGRQIYVSDRSDGAVRTLAVNRGNTAPIAGTPTVGTADANGKVTGTLNFTDPEGDTLTYSPAQPTAGTVTVNTAGTFTFAPNATARAAAAAGGPTTVTFAVTASDGKVGKTVSVTAPIAPAASIPKPPAQPTPPAQPSQPTQPTPPASIPSGDATAYLQGLFDNLKPGDTLTLAPGTYKHSGVLKLNVSNVTINGNGVTLQATNDATSSVQILANNVTVNDLTLTAALTGPRYESLDQHKLVIEGNGNTLNNVTINGSAAAGVFVYGASNFTLNHVTVKNTRADGIHMTNGANNGHVNYAVTQNTGDDGISVISYSGAPIDHDIVIESPTVNGTTWGRGISVVGGQNITYNNINVSGTDAAGVYIAAEGSPWFTLSTSGVTITGGTVTNANKSSTTQQGAVLIYNGSTNQSVSNVTISGLTISGTPSSAYRNVGIVATGGTVSGIKFNNIAITNTTAVSFAKSSNVPAGSYTTSGWTRNGSSITA